MSEEIMVTDPVTGGKKGMKAERFSHMPYNALAEVARVYHYGSSKYHDPDVGPYNYRRGYLWSLSYDSLLRHLTAWWEGEDINEESGRHHLAHAVWHGLTLLYFVLSNKGTDDRPSSSFWKF